VSRPTGGWRCQNGGMSSPAGDVDLRRWRLWVALAPDVRLSEQAGVHERPRDRLGDHPPGVVFGPCEPSGLSGLGVVVPLSSARSMRSSMSSRLMNRDRFFGGRDGAGDGCVVGCADGGHSAGSADPGRKPTHRASRRPLWTLLELAERVDRTVAAEPGSDLEQEQRVQLGPVPELQAHEAEAPRRRPPSRRRSPRRRRRSGTGHPSTQVSRLRLSWGCGGAGWSRCCSGACAACPRR
jgi:hypothetical protein